MDYTEIDQQLAFMFDGYSYLTLTMPIRAMLCADAMHAMRQGDSLPRYVANIGKTNVEAYAKALVAGFSRWGVQANADEIEQAWS